MEKIINSLVEDIIRAKEDYKKEQDERQKAYLLGVITQSQAVIKQYNNLK